MSKTQNQKLKMMYLLKILLENSDEENVLSMSKIIDSLAAFGVSAERKSIYDDIECLRLIGYDVISQKGQNMGYYIGEREFELAELKLLVDSVQSSKFITKKKTTQLIKKIEGLTSKFYGKELQRQVYISDRVKTINETIYYNVDTLHNAIVDGVKIAFKYYEYNLEKKRQLRNDGKDYIVSPYSLTFSDENYYLIAHYPKNEKLTHFRVDRMDDIRFLDEKCEDINIVMKDEIDMVSNSFNLGAYLKKTFDMYGGETQCVAIRCENRLINAVIDKFGEDVRIKKDGNEHFVATFNVYVSPTFYAWIFTFGDKIEIVSPENIVSDFVNITKNILGKY
jgi:predicted DNA-binding transcriptional regulator YafY